MFHETFKPLLDVSFSKSRQQVLPVGLVAAILIDVHIARVWIVILFAQKDFRVCSSWHTLNLSGYSLRSFPSLIDVTVFLPWESHRACITPMAVMEFHKNNVHVVSQIQALQALTCNSGQLSKESDSSRISNIKSG